MMALEVAPNQSGEGLLDKFPAFHPSEGNVGRHCARSFSEELAKLSSTLKTPAYDGLSSILGSLILFLHSCFLASPPQ